MVKDMFWVLSVPGRRGEQGNSCLSKTRAISKKENCPLWNKGCYSYDFDGFKKASTAGSVFQG